MRTLIGPLGTTEFSIHGAASLPLQRAIAGLLPALCSFVMLKNLLIAIPFCLASQASAQVQPGHGFRFSISPIAPGLELIDLTSGVSTRVDNLPTPEFNAGVLDPVTGVLYAVDWAELGNRGQIWSMKLGDSAVVSSKVFADVGATSGINSVALDRNGDLFAADGRNIWKVHRDSGAVSLWDVNAAGYKGTFNDIALDPATQTMWVVTFGSASTPGSQVIKYDLDLGPGPGKVLLDIGSAGFSEDSSGISYDGAGNLYVVNFGQGGNGETLFRFDTVTETASSVVGRPNHSLNAVWIDQSAGQLHTSGLAGQPSWEALDLSTGALRLLNRGISAGSPSYIGINNLLHSTQLYPREHRASDPFLLEASAHGQEGDFAALLLVSLGGVPLANPEILGTGRCDRGGFFVYNRTVSAGEFMPGTSAGVQAVVRDSITSKFHYGLVETITLLP